MRFLVIALLAILPSVALGAEPEGKLALPDFDALSAHASQSVTITLDASLLTLAARFLDSGDPEESAIRDMIHALQGIYVKSYTFDKDFVYPASSVDAVRRQLTAPNWQRIVEVHSSKEHSSVDIFICQVQAKTRGLAIIAAEPHELTVVNIVGTIDLEKLHKLEGHFGIPKIGEKSD